MWKELANVVGIIGVVLILYTYFCLQTERLSRKSITFSWINIVGSLLIMYSLFFYFNLPSFLIEVVWLAISIYALLQAYQRKSSE